MIEPPLQGGTFDVHEGLTDCGDRTPAPLDHRPSRLWCGGGSWHTVDVNFEELYDRFRQPVWRLARRLTDSDDEALDASQEIFIRVWKGLPGFRGEAKVSTWIFQIAWNYLRWYRRRQGRSLKLVADNPGSQESILDRLADPAPGPERQVSSAELVDRVEEAIAGLPEHYRATIWLRDGEGLSYEDIATVLDIPIGTVRSRLARARMALRRVVET